MFILFCKIALPQGNHACLTHYYRRFGGRYIPLSKGNTTCIVRSVKYSAIPTRSLLSHQSRQCWKERYLCPLCSAQQLPQRSGYHSSQRVTAGLPANQRWSLKSRFHGVSKGTSARLSGSVQALGSTRPGDGLLFQCAYHAGSSIRMRWRLGNLLIPV